MSTKFLLSVIARSETTKQSQDCRASLAMTIHILVKPNKLLGQNFLKCRWVVDTLVGAANITKEDTILEIGPGTGTLTRDLAKLAKKVIAVEKDQKLAENLSERLKKEGITNTEIITGDILKIFPEIAATYKLQPTSYKLVANIPYYITGHLLKKLLEEWIRPHTIVLTIQKEVAERIVARDGKMSVLSLSIQAFGTPEIIKIVPASCFEPEPQVDSAVLRISGISDLFFTKNNLKPEDFFRIVRLGFSQKRKMLLNSLASAVEDKKTLEEVLKSAKIPVKARPEELSLEEWARLIFCINSPAKPN